MKNESERIEKCDVERFLSKKKESGCAVFLENSFKVQELPLKQNPLKDACQMFVLKNSKNNKPYIMTISNLRVPERVLESITRTEKIKNELNTPLNEVFISPENYGEIGSRSYSIHAMKKTFSSNKLLLKYQHIVYQKKILAWWLTVLKKTKNKISTSEINNLIMPRLHNLMASKTVCSLLQKKTQVAIDTLRTMPKPLFYTFEHTDFRFHNFVYSSKNNNDYGFYLIDTDLVSLKGMCIYDFLRFIMSTRPSKCKIRHYIKEVCSILQCEPKTLELYLIISCAKLFENLNHFPIQRYNAITTKSIHLLGDILRKKTGGNNAKKT